MTTTLSGNKPYIKLDDVEVNAYFQSAKLTPSASTEEVTAGSGVEHIQRNPKLRDHKMDITLTYDTADLQTYIRKLRPGQIVQVEYGPEWNLPGKPRHVQDFIFEEAPHELAVEKNKVTFALSGVAADAPVVDMYTGGVYV